MKFHADREQLLKTLQKVVGITDKKTTMPILSHVLLETLGPNRTAVFATDLNLSLRTYFEASVEQEGKLCVSARKLLELAREVSVDALSLELLANQRLAIQAGRSYFELTTLAPEDFPHIAIHDDVSGVQVSAPELRAALSRASYAIPVDEDPFSVPGLYWHALDGKRVRMVSSDGHRLAYEELALDSVEALGVGKGVTIPRKGVQEMIRMFEKEESVNVVVHESRLIVASDALFLSIQLLEEEFPDYELIIPQERPHHLTVHREGLFLALKRMAVLTDQTWRHVRFIMRDGELELETGNPELGTARERLDVQYKGDEFTVAFNIRYVLDAIHALESDAVRLEWLDEFHGAIFCEPDNPGRLGLVMPMMV